jgi:cytochrome P450
LLRFDPSIQIAGRVCLDDYSIEDTIIPKGATVTLVIGSANRDPEIFCNPDELDITRQPNRHLTFGAGTHYCMGDWLARKQAQMAFTSLLKNFRAIKSAQQPAEWNRIITFRSVKRLMITVA